MGNPEPQGGWHCTSTFYQTLPNHQTQASWPSMPLDPKITGPAPQYERRMQAKAHRHAQTDEEATKKWWHRIRNMESRNQWSMLAFWPYCIHTLDRQQINASSAWCFSRPPASDSSKILSKQPLQHTGIDHKATCHVFDGIFQPGLNGISTRLTWTMQDTDTDPENTQQTLKSTLSSEAKLPVHDLLCIEIPSRLAARLWTTTWCHREKLLRKMSARKSANQQSNLSAQTLIDIQDKVQECKISKRSTCFRPWKSAISTISTFGVNHCDN